LRQSQNRKKEFSSDWSLIFSSRKTRFEDVLTWVFDFFEAMHTLVLTAHDTVKPVVTEQMQSKLFLVFI
jgi:hypothetical protein